MSLELWEWCLVGTSGLEVGAVAEGRSEGRRVLKTGGGGVFGVTERNGVLRRGGQVRFVKKRIS